MPNNYANMMLVRMELTDEADSVIVANDGQGLILIENFPILIINIWMVSVR